MSILVNALFIIIIYFESSHDLFLIISFTNRRPRGCSRNFMEARYQIVSSIGISKLDEPKARYTPHIEITTPLGN